MSTGIYTPNTGYNQTSLAPKFGLVYQPIKDRISLFANYMNGFVNVQPAEVSSGVFASFKPQYGTQWEGGVKLDVIKNKFNATLSYYDIKVTNSTYKDASNFMVQDGPQNSKGFEVELITNPVQGLNIVAGYAIMKINIQTILLL